MIYPRIQLIGRHEETGLHWFARFDPQPYGTVEIELTDFVGAAPDAILGAIQRLNPTSRVTLGVLNWE